MTQEEKANAYDEVIRIAKKKYKMVQNLCKDSQIDVDFLKDELTDIFPKLEDEMIKDDEKLRQDLILFLDTFWHLGKNGNFDKWSTADCADWIAWVGKQGKKVNVIEGFDTEFEKQVSSLLASVINKNDEYTEGFVKWASQSLLGYAKHEIEKQNEQKPAVKDSVNEDKVMKELLYNYIVMNENTPSSDEVFSTYGKSKEDILAWIEKQGEQKSAWSEKDERNLQGIIDEIKANKHNAPDYDLATYNRYLSWLKSLRPQNYQKPQSIQKRYDIGVYEPKFSVGDWIVTEFSNVVHIESISNGKYVLKTSEGVSFDYDVSVEYIDKNWHRWCIEDAKDGDVLISTYSDEPFIYNGRFNHFYVSAYCALDSDGKFEVGDIKYGGKYNVRPATKDQRGQLEKAMTNEGYTFDFENKEVIEIK